MTHLRDFMLHRNSSKKVRMEDKLKLSQIRVLTGLLCLAVLAGCNEESSSKIPLLKVLDNALIDSQGKAISTQKRLGNKDYILLYFAAHWAAPCREFTPDLVKFYNKNNRRGSFEVILISSDRNQTDMQNHIKNSRMPWISVMYGSVCAQQLKYHYSGQGIPRLVLIDNKGRIISDTFRNNRYTGPHRVLEDLHLLIAEKGESVSASMVAKRYKVSGLASGKGQRMAIINGNMLTEGQNINSDTVVTRITPDYVEIEINGEPFRLLPEVNK